MKLRWPLIAGSLIVTAAIAYFFHVLKESPRPRPAAGPSTAAAFPVSPLSSSPYLNTHADAAYVGSEACRTCHPGHYASFRRTGMGRSMALAQTQASEPPDAAFDHAISKQRFQVVRAGGQMLHRQWLLTDGPEEVLLSEYVVKYVVGSGRNSFTYFIEADGEAGGDGFLAESPLTWYASKKSWGMSPGYDRETHPGFERPIGDNCLHCHAGRAENIGASPNRIDFKELAIGCERCHGPGALHAERHAPKKANGPIQGETDFTIVNPARLSRSLAEAICQDCHLSGPASIQARGRKLDDFRPGLPLQDFRHDFHLATPGKNMTVVGHVEQMHMSRCFQGNKTFSCLTCHDPHHEPSAGNRAAHYQKICLQCHQAEKCKVDPAIRQKHEPGNNCVHCHMPTAPTDIPHVAFTHHRVGLHDLATIGVPENTRPTVLSQLEPILDLSALSDIDRMFSMGLGYIGVAEANAEPKLAAEFRMRGLGLLTKVRAAGLRDGVLDLNLATLKMDSRRDEALQLARGAETLGGLSARQRCVALFLVAEGLARAGKPREAIPRLRELAGLRRDSKQMVLLADCERAVGDPGYVQSLEAAVRINPRLWQVHKHLADVYRRQGNLAKADYHDKRAVK